MKAVRHLYRAAFVLIALSFPISMASTTNGNHVENQVGAEEAKRNKDACIAKAREDALTKERNARIISNGSIELEAAKHKKDSDLESQRYEREYRSASRGKEKGQAQKEHQGRKSDLNKKHRERVAAIRKERSDAIRKIDDQLVEDKARC